MDFIITIYDKKKHEYNTICDEKNKKLINNYLKKIREKNDNFVKRKTKIRIKNTSSEKSISSKKRSDSNISEGIIKLNISKNLRKSESNMLNIERKDPNYLIPDKKSKKLSFQKPNNTSESLHVLSQNKLISNNLENFTKRSRTEEVNDNLIESLGEIDVVKRLSKDQKTESYNIFHDNKLFSELENVNTQGIFLVY